MKTIKKKIARTIKYYKVGFQQISKEEREFYGAGVFMIVVFFWWFFQGVIANAIH